MYRQALWAPIVILAIQSLPDKSLSVTAKNLPPILLILELKFPPSSTSVYRFIILTLGILTLSKAIVALSTPLFPIFRPMSVIDTPDNSFNFPSLIGTRKAPSPSFFPLTIVYPNTRAWLACLNPFVIQCFWLRTVGELTTNSFVASS